MALKKMSKPNNQGMTLLEVLVATFILAIVALPLLNVFAFNTSLVRRTGEISDTTYATQSVLEDLQRLSYTELYAKAPLPGTRGNYQLRSVGGSTLYVTRSVSIDRLPSGSFDSLVSGKACYAHLIVRGGSAIFTGPDGAMRSGLSYSSGVTITSTTATIGGSTFSLNKPAGANMILIINAGTSAIPDLKISLPSSDAYVLYALSTKDSVAQNILPSGGNGKSKIYRKFNSKTDSTMDPPPDTALVNVVCKVYNANGSLESLVQSTLKAVLP